MSDFRVEHANRSSRIGVTVVEPGLFRTDFLGGSLGVMFFLNLLLGTAIMVLGVLFYLFVVRPWVAQRLYRRALDAAIDNRYPLEGHIQNAAIQAPRSGAPEPSLDAQTRAELDALSALQEPSAPTRPWWAFWRSK